MRLLLPVLLSACTPDPTGTRAPGVQGPAPAMDLSLPHFWAAPFPADHRRHDDGTVDLAGLQAQGNPAILDQLIALIDGKETGFSSTSTVHLPVGFALEEGGLPTLKESLAPDASVFLVDVDPDSPHLGEQVPVDAILEEDPGPYGTPWLLSLVPLQGLPLRPETTYAAVLTRELRAADGQRLGQAEAVGQLAAGQVPAGLTAEEADAWRESLDALPIPASDVAAFTRFTTGQPTQDMARLAEAALTLDPPELDRSLQHAETWSDYCVYESTLSMPVWQSGEPPYMSGGGAITWDTDGAPVLDHEEQARVFVTVPREAPPPGGFPALVFIRTGGGGDRPLVDRGPRDEAGGPDVPGTGLAAQLAEIGVVGVQVDGPHGGLRNITGGDEQFLVFNINNPAALRDNLRQSAAELVLLPGVLDGIASVQVGGAGAECPHDDLTDPLLDTDELALFGHSMGASIAPLVLANQPRYTAAAMSGAGGSWLENIIHKEEPLEVQPLAEAMLGYAETGRELTRHDPVLGLLQWGGEAADVPPYLASLRDESSPDLLVVQGIVDRYILPPMANATALSARLDLAGAALDADHPELAELRSFTEIAPYADLQHLDGPVSGNRDGRTAVVVQHAEDGIEDGHEVLFQLPAPKQQLQAFLADWATGAVPEVPTASRR